LLEQKKNLAGCERKNANREKKKQAAVEIKID